MVRILVMVKFLACTPGARTNPRHWKAQCQAKEGTPLLHMPLFGLICGTDYTKPGHRLPPQVALLRGITQVRQTRTAGSSLCPIVEFSEVYEAPVVLSCSVEYPSNRSNALTCFVANDATKGPSSHAELVCAHSVESRAHCSTHCHFPA